MYHRIFDIENRLDEAMFLFGSRHDGLPFQVEGRCTLRGFHLELRNLFNFIIGFWSLLWVVFPTFLVYSQNFFGLYDENLFGSSAI